MYGLFGHKERFQRCLVDGSAVCLLGNNRLPIGPVNNTFKVSRRKDSSRKRYATNS